MIKKLEINGVHAEVTPDLRKYITKKIGKLDHYLPRHARESLHVEVFIKESNIKGNKRVCEIILYAPHEVLTAKESTMNIFAAVDIAEAKLKNQIKKYKEMHSTLRIHRRVINRFRRTPDS